jgi:hypothetical protein
MQICRQFDDPGIVGDIRTDLFDESKQSSGMCDRPILPNLQGHLDYVMEGKLMLDHSFPLFESLQNLFHSKAARDSEISFQLEFP